MGCKTLMCLGVLCLAVCIGLTFFTEDAHAQSGDQKIAQMEGLGNKEWDEDKLPGKLEISLGVGSIFVMIAVVKYL